jgi:hypothetical protein
VATWGRAGLLQGLVDLCEKNSSVSSFGFVYTLVIVTFVLGPYSGSLGYLMYGLGKPAPTLVPSPS